MASHSHEHDGLSHAHSNGADHGHTHEILDGPGSFLGREMPIIEGRDWSERAFTVGIGGYVRVQTSSGYHLFQLELTDTFADQSAPARQL